MVWTREKDLVLLQEIAAEGVMHQKPKSRDKGCAWQKVVDNINCLPGYEVSSRSVRDRYNNLVKKHKVKMGKEERATGGGGSELSEWESILEELIEINEESEQRAAEENHAKEILVNEDKAKAIEMRKRAMETVGETKTRTGNGSKEEKRRRSASQSLQWLQDAIKSKQLQAEEERKAQEEERKERMEERKAIQEEMQRREREQSNLFEQLQNQQYSQQQQQQQFQMMQQFMMQMLEQQQKQSDMILELLKGQKK